MLVVFFNQSFYLNIEIFMCFSVFKHIYVIFLYLLTCLCWTFMHFKDKANFVMLYSLCDVSILFVTVFGCVLVSVHQQYWSIEWVCVSVWVYVCYVLGIGVILAWVLLFLIFESLRNFGYRTSLKVWYNYLVKPSVPGFI